jgi:multidrug efflux pump
MNISKFFIDRPIFASVISIFIFITGLISIDKLPVAEYPEVSPPTVVIRAAFPGASPKVISETVATPLEEQINGVENMLYMSSQATSDGVLGITVTFKLGTDGDLAQQMVQNRVSQALPRLPEEVRALGVTVVKSSPDLTMVVHLTSPNNRYDTLYLRNYATLNIKDNLARIKGVGLVRMFGGGDYAMRIWLNPQKIAERKLTAAEIVRAIRDQNIQVAAGTIGQYPVPKDVDLQLTINAQGRLQSVEEFEDIIVKVNPDGGITKLKDVARVELGSSENALQSMLNNQPAAAIAIFQMPDANAIQVSDDVRAAMKKIKKSMPEGVDYQIVYDPTVFVRDSIKAVIHTLLEAILLVVLVVIVFLQTWRASIIPLLAVPVSVIGTFALMHLFGFSINTLSLFGLVLAIGIVVDDAIVVVENVERNIEKGLNPRDATYQAMREVSGPIIAIALTLCAVFIPIAFISGLSGQFYKQFALTISISTIISTINSLTLSPALAALLLKGHDEPKDWLGRQMDKYFGWFFARFNRFFSRSSEAYGNTVIGVINRKSLALFIYAILIGLTYFGFKIVPPGFVPAQDKQYLIGFAQLQDGATLDRTKEVLKQMSDIALKEEGVGHAVAFPGLSINGFTISSSAGIVFLPLKPFGERDRKDLSGFAIAGKLNQKFAAINDAFIAIFPPPPVRGLGTIGGFKLQIEDREDMGYEELNRVVTEVTGKAYQNPALMAVFSNYKINIPQLDAVLDREKAKQLGLNISDIYATMQIYLGSLYVNDFNKFGRTYQVIAQADSEFRAHKEDIVQLKAKNDKGEMIPLGSVLTINESHGPQSAIKYNAYRAADLNGSPGFGYSSGQAEEAIIKILDETLPKGMTYEWTDLKYQQILAGNTAIYIFPLCVLFVFLVLAAKYESLTLPFAVILIVPMCVLSAIVGVFLWGGDNNIFTQISLFVLIGLACKNAILIVEFAHELEVHHGRTIVQAALEACRLRLRPILMTSFAFIMGVTPLVISTGAGSEMRQAIGVAVFSGMLGVTFFGLFLTPIFYVVLRKIADKVKGKTEVKKA